MFRVPEWVALGTARIFCQVCSKPTLHRVIAREYAFWRDLEPHYEVGFRCSCCSRLWTASLYNEDEEVDDGSIKEDWGAISTD